MTQWLLETDSIFYDTVIVTNWLVLDDDTVIFTKSSGLDDIVIFTNRSAQDDDTVIVTNGSALSVEVIRVYLALYILQVLDFVAIWLRVSCTNF
jgi:hypothetical protein